MAKKKKDFAYADMEKLRKKIEDGSATDQEKKKYQKQKKVKFSERRDNAIFPKKNRVCYSRLLSHGDYAGRKRSAVGLEPASIRAPPFAARWQRQW